MEKLFAGSGILSKFIVKRDRVRLFVWLAALAGFVIAFIPVFYNMFGEGAGGVMEKSVMVEMMKNPAMIAIVGPVYGAANYTTGAMYANFMLVFSAMIAAVMNIFLVARHTRHDEELGRLEVIRSLPVGRLSNYTSTMSVVVILNVVLTVLTGLGMFLVRQDGMNFNGCMLFAACLGVTGLFFAAVTAIFCQLSANNKTATTAALFFMLILYMLRAAGDMKSETLSRISPLGLILRTKTFVSNHWWPVLVVGGISIVLMVLAAYLAGIRDLGRGLFPEKPGRRHASALLSSPYGLAFKLLRNMIIIWAVTIFVLAGMYGSVFGDIDSFLSSNATLKAIFLTNPKFSAVEQFMSLLMVVMSVISAIPVLSFVGKVASEEKQGHAENIFGKSVSRHAQLLSYLIPTLVMGALFQLLTALGFWSVGSVVLDTVPSLGIFLKAAFIYLPGIYVFVGLSVFLTAYLPGKTTLAYAYLAYSFFMVYLGKIAGFPEWTTKTTPFGFISQYPIEKVHVLPLVVLSLIAVVLGALGFIGYRKRDVKNPS